ncbi:type IV toxin-antitoxin system AbiEi family antitoxin domain-containing protein [Pseudonocardia saturnea]
MGRRRAPLPASLRLLDSALRALAAERGGVVTAAQVHALGGDDSAIRTLVGSGGWWRARRGVYLDRRRSVDARGDAAHHARCAALLASLRAPAVVSHLSAVRLLGLPLPPDGGGGRACVTRRPPAPSNDPLLGDVHVTDYDETDVVLVDGVPVLAGARLVLDCCAVLAPDSALAVADAALRRGLTTADDLEDELRRRRGHAGAPAAALVVERADPGGTNWFESMSRWWLLEAGLPRPRLQVPFADALRYAEVDMWFEEYRTIGEADGAGKYDEPGALFAEKRREDWLRDRRDVEVVRWVPVEMRGPRGRREVVARFERAFARRC